MNDKSTQDKNKETMISPPIQRRKSKLIKKPPPIERKTGWMKWLFWFSSTTHKVKIKEKYESVLYLPNEDSKEDLPNQVERKPEFNKSLSSDKMKSNSMGSNNSKGGKLKSSINNDWNDLNRKLSKTEKTSVPIVNTNDRKQNAINNYHRRHSWTIAVLKLDSNKESMSGQYQNGMNTLAQDQGNTARIHKKRPHKKSWDSSSHSSHSGHGGPISNHRLKLKAKEVQANNAFKGNNYNNSKTMKWSNSIKEKSQGRNTLQSKNLPSHKESKDSQINDVMNESYVPPMIIDNSAVIFSSPKKANKKKFTRAQTRNPLQSDLDKSDIDMGSKEEDKSDKSSYGDSEEDYDGEGESYSSSCTWSSCLRDKNADNAVSLKLSQYSYKPTQGAFQRNETDGEMNMSGYKDIINTSQYNDQSTNKGLNTSKVDPSVEDFS